MAVTQRLMTAEELWDMPDIPGKQHELVRGELIEVPTPGAIHNVIADIIHHLLRVFVTERRLGIVFGDNMGYVLHRGPDTVRIPDVSFVAWEHVPETGTSPMAWLDPSSGDLISIDRIWSRCSSWFIFDGTVRSGSEIDDIATL